MTYPNHKNQSKNQLALPWKTRISIVVLSNFNDICLRRDGTVNRLPFRLLGTVGFYLPPDPKPRNGVSTSDVTVDPSRNLWFRVFSPTPTASNSSIPVVVFCHGGGFVHLTPDFKSYDAVCRKFARRMQAVIVSVNYRLAPEHKWPAQYEDGFDVLKFLDTSGKGVLPVNADLKRCFLAGDSAGANLQHHVAKRVAENPAKFKRLKVIGLVAIQPFFGGEKRTRSEIELAGVDMIVSVERTDWMWKAFLPEGPEMNRDHEVINVSGPKAVDISKLDFPPTMVVVAGFDSLKDWQIKYYKWLKRSGKEAYLLKYPNMIHGFYVFPELPESSQIVSEVKQFIDKQCSRVIS